MISLFSMIYSDLMLKKLVVAMLIGLLYNFSRFKAKHNCFFQEYSTMILTSYPDWHLVFLAY